MLKQRLTIVSTLWLAGFMGSASWSVAQDPIRRPIISPYMQLLRPQQGSIPNYQNFVEPRFEMERIRQLQFENERQFEEKLLQEREIVRGFISQQARPTGRVGAGTFLNYLHFYPQGSAVVIPRRY